MLVFHAGGRRNSDVFLINAMEATKDVLNAQLWDAVSKDDVKVAKRLMQKGASVSARSEPFHVCAFY